MSFTLTTGGQGTVATAQVIWSFNAQTYTFRSDNNFLSWITTIFEVAEAVTSGLALTNPLVLPYNTNANGWSLNTLDNNGTGGSITMAGGTTFVSNAGSINTSGGEYNGGSINTSNGGGSIDISENGGSIDTSGVNSQGTGGSINTSANGTANGGSINTSAGDNDGGVGGFIYLKGGESGYTIASNGGNISLGGGEDNCHAGSIISNGGTGTNANGGTLNMSGGFLSLGGSITSIGVDSYSGGSLVMSGGNGGAGGSINTSGDNNAGGSINTSDGGGSINTQGVGSIQFGISGTRTILNGSATTDQTITLPDTTGTLIVGSASATAGGVAVGEYLEIYIGGVQRKIALLLP